jgi:hypothetical protein
MKRPWIFALGTVLVLLAALSWTLKRSDWLSDRLRTPIEQGLRQASGRSVTVDGVGAGLSGWIWLHGVSMGPAKGERAMDISLTAQAVGLKLDLWDLLRGRVDLGSLRAVQVENPRLYLLRRDLPQAAPLSPTPSIQDWEARLKDLPVPPVTMQLNGGQVWDQPFGRAPRLAAEDVALHVDPRQDQGLRLSGQGRLPGGGTLAAWGLSGPGWKGVELSLRAQDMALGRLNLLPSPLSITAGTFSGQLAIQPAPGAWPDGLGLHGEGQLKGVDAGRGGRPGIEALGAQWKLQSGRLELTGLSARAWDGRLRGEGRLDLATLALSATVEAQDASLAGLALMAGAPDDLGLDGRAHMQIALLGAVTAPALTAGLQAAAATWQGHALSGIDLALKLQLGQAEAHGSLAWDGGRGELDLDAKDGSLRSARFKANALPADWFKAWAKTDLGGRLDGELDYRRAAGGGLGPWQVQLRAPKVSLGGRELAKAVLEAQGDGQSAHLRLDSDLPQWPQLGLQAEAQRQKDGTWNLRNTKLNQHGRLLAALHGSWKPGVSGTAGTLQLVFHSSPVSVSQLPGWSGFQELSGSVQADGQLAYDGGWTGSLDASASNLAGPGGALPLQAALQFGPQGVSLTSLALRHGEWTASAWAPAPDGPWQGQLRANDGALAPLAALSPASGWGLSGTANGSLSFDMARGAVDARLTLSDPLPARLASATLTLDLGVDQGHVDLRGLKLSQPSGGTLAGQAEWDLSGRRAWKGEARWVNLLVQGSRSSGRLRLDGGAGSDGRLQLDPWDLGGDPLPALEGLLSFEDGHAADFQAKAGRDLSLSVKRDGGHWQARAVLAGADPGPWLGLAVGQSHATDLRLNGWAEAGPWVRGQPLPLRGHLEEQGEPGSGMDWQGQWSFGRGPTGTASWHGLDLARAGTALKALGLGLPKLQGRLQGRLAGGPDGATLTGQVQDFNALEMDFGGASFAGGWSPGTFRVDEFKADGSGPRLQLDKALWQRVPGGWDAQGDLKAQALSLAIFDVDVDAHVQARARDGAVNGQLLAHDLALGVRHWKELALEGTWGQDAWTLKEQGRSPSLQAHGTASNGVFSMAIDGRSGAGKGSLTGTVGPKGLLHLQGQAQGMDAADLAGIMGWDQDWHGSAWGTLAVTGDTNAAHTLVDAKVEDGSVGGLPFDLASGLVRQDGDWVDLAPVLPIRLSRKSGVSLEVTGKIPLASSTAEGVDVRAELKQGGLGLFTGVPGIAQGEGPLEMKLRFHGRRDDPKVDGSLKVTDGRLTPAWMLPPLEKVQIFAQMTDGRVELQQARGQVAGDGPLVRLELADPHRPAFVFERWEPAQFNLRLRSSASGLQVRSNPALRFVDGTIAPDLVLSGSWEAPTISGSVALFKGDGDGGKASVLWPAEFNPPAKPTDSGFLDRLNLDLRLLARKDVLVRTDAAQVFVDTGPDGLRVGGPPDARTLVGTLKMTQGSVDYLLASFKLAQDHESSVEMRGADPPVLELWGVKDITGAYVLGDPTPRDLEVRLHAYGPLGQVQMRLESDASDLSQSQLASLTGLGRDASDPRNQGGFARLLGSVSAGIFTKWARSTGLVDEVGLQLPFVDSYLNAQTTPGAENVGQAQAPDNTATARSLVEVSVGKYIGEKLFLGVNGQVDQRPSANNSSIQTGAVGGKLEYQLQNHARVSLESNVDATGVQDQRVMLQKSSSFENYNPGRRRWDQDATPVPSPAAAPNPSPSPSPTVQPLSTATPGA